MKFLFLRCVLDFKTTDMRKSFLLMVFLAAPPLINAQETPQILVEGDIVTLGTPKGSDYRAIDFPRKNIIIKRGAIPNFNALIGEKLVVKRIEEDKNGIKQAILRRKDGLNFFRFYPTVRVEIAEAMESGEIKG